jgi:hypothetical protein
MTLLQLDDGKLSLCDCDAMCATTMRTQFSDTWPTDRLGHLPSTYLSVRIGILTTCGVKEVHEYFPIQKVWDTDVTGTTPDCDEYVEYMDLRRTVGWKNVKPRTRYDPGSTRLRVMNLKNDDLADNANAQSEHRDMGADITHGSVMLCGDTDAVTRKDIQRHYNNDSLSLSLALGSHHGSITFFDDPSDNDHYYTGAYQGDGA